MPPHPQVFRAAVDLKQRDLVTECLLLLLPQFGSPTADSTGAQPCLWVMGDSKLEAQCSAGCCSPGPLTCRASGLAQRSCLRPLRRSPAAVSEAIDYMDATLSKVVLTQVRHSWVACCTASCASLRWTCAALNCRIWLGCPHSSPSLSSPPHPAAGHARLATHRSRASPPLQQRLLPLRLLWARL